MFKLSKTPNGCDKIWVIVDRFTKMTRFISIKQTFSLDKFTRQYVDKIISHFETLMHIISNQDPQFISKFWSNLQEAFGTKLHFSTTFYQQTDGQSEKTIKTL